MKTRAKPPAATTNTFYNSIMTTMERLRMSTYCMQTEKGEALKSIEEALSNYSHQQKIGLRIGHPRKTDKKYVSAYLIYPFRVDFAFQIRRLL